MKLRLKKWKTKSQPFTKKNMPTTKNLTALCGMWLKSLEQMEHAEVRRLITEDKVRPDGRKVDEIRPLDALCWLRSPCHGSGLFTRGQTQALSVLTLAPMGETQIIDGLDPEYKKRFMHHYNFPQYSRGNWTLRCSRSSWNWSRCLGSVRLLKYCQAWKNSHMRFV